ncbi:hypothetical protein BDN70DRAFT_884211 [Pholiota conissans]|uniref:Uncharacterized protein n=1 Tax=Pholiota conissans TaxID=109636 RepID=A0A9P5YTS7_9AGAR|nr:hypothetical protein BDN70DRAFT_884211 [Pholiota conissans]
MASSISNSHTNESWGKANSKSLWSLWRMNTLLVRKPVSAAWTAKSPPPFRPLWRLTSSSLYHLTFDWMLIRKSKEYYSPAFSCIITTILNLQVPSGSLH